MTKAHQTVELKEAQGEIRAGNNGTSPQTVEELLTGKQRAMLRKKSYDPDYIKQVVNLFLREPGDVIEVRGIGWKGTSSGYFDSADKLAQCVRRLDGKCEAIWIIPNPLKRDFIAIRDNVIKDYLKKGEGTPDTGVITRRWLCLDFDPVRTKGTSATDEELALAIERGRACTEWLELIGWPKPIPGLSGNGGHWLYRLPDLPNDNATLALISDVFDVLDERFTDGVVEFDTTLKNAARCIKLYGTMMCKGANRPDMGRVHRRSYLDIPDELPPMLTVENLRDAAALKTKTQQKQHTIKTDGRDAHRDIVEFLAAKGINYNRKDKPGYVYYETEKCLTGDGKHDGTGFGFQVFPSGAAIWHCHHNTCSGETGRGAWDVMGIKTGGATETVVSLEELDGLLQAAIDAPPETRNEALDNLARGLTWHDPFTVEGFANKAKEAGLCGKTALKDAVKRIIKDTSPGGKDGARGLMTNEYIELLESWGYDIRLNLCNDDVEIGGEPITDIEEQQIKAQVRDYGLADKDTYTNTTHAIEALVTAAAHHAYHPIKDYLNSLQWDGDNHIGALVTYFTDEHGLFCRWFPHWLIGSVAKIADGYQNPVLVLDGAQEIGKSYFARWLCPLPKHFNAAAIYPENKDCKLRLIDTWVWEVEEMGTTTRKADLEALKAFLTTQIVRERKSYGRRDIIKPALASFIGTINNEAGFLVDRTGNRRFLTCTLTGVNWDYAQKIDVAQLWAQAVHQYNNSNDWQLSAADKEERDEINQEYMVDRPVDSWLNEWIGYTGDYDDAISTNEIQLALSTRLGAIRHADVIAIAAVMKEMKATWKRETVSRGGRCKIWRGVKWLYNPLKEERKQDDDGDDDDEYKNGEQIADDIPGFESTSG